MDETLKRDANRITVMGAVADDSDKEIFQVRGNPITKRLLVDNDALPENTDGVYIGDVKLAESLPAGTNTIGTETNSGAIKTATEKLVGFEIPKYDEIVLTYISDGGASDGEIETVTYKSEASTVATLTLSYIGAQLTSIIKT